PFASSVHHPQLHSFPTHALPILQGCANSDKTEQDIPDATDERYAEHVRTSEFQTPEEEMHGFILPPGFEVTLFASEPDITKPIRSEEHTSELQSREKLVCRLLLE